MKKKKERGGRRERLRREERETKNGKKIKSNLIEKNREMRRM